MDICGHCGGTEGDKFTALCNNCGGDFWVQPRDFDKPELKEYIADAAKNLDITVEKLQDMVV
tara:strand:- start:7094 stop:7279 length:186 start_codon:yes stop_codon:yes gene_type:complete